MKVLSLFDGMSCGMLAMKTAGFHIEKYVAYEIDKFAEKTSCHNFPQIEHKGDVFAADFTQYKGFDYLIGGSPCTYWSIAKSKNRETTASGIGWELFNQYVRALHEAQPKYFLYENNKSMAAAIRESINKSFGFEPICINSALVSAQNRSRLYWCGVRQIDGSYKKADISQPEDRMILLKDILETNADNVTPLSEKEIDYMLRGHLQQRWTHCNKPGQDDKGKCLVANVSKGVPYNVLAEKIKPMNCELASVNNSDSGIVGMLDMKGQEQVRRVYGTNGKSPTLTTCQGGHREPKIFEAIATQENIPIPTYEVKNGMITVKGKQYPIKLIDGFYIIRKLTVTECKRLQTVPEWYEFPVSNTQAYKMLGNGWTVEVIAHILKGLKN